MAHEKTKLDKEFICRTAKSLVQDVPTALHEQICWDNFNNDLKRKLNLQRTDLLLTLPPGSFDAIFQPKQKNPASTYEYWISLSNVKELEGVLTGNHKINLNTLVTYLHEVYELLILTKAAKSLTDEQRDRFEDVIKEVDKAASEIVGTEKSDEPPWVLNTLLSAFTKSLLPYLTQHNIDYADQSVVKSLEQAKEGSKLSATSDIVQCEVSRLLQCARCKQVLVEPKTLPCLHSFCMECLKGSIQKDSLQSTINCQSCETRFQLADGSEEQLKKFPRNPTLEALMLLHDACKSSPQNCTQCELCFGLEPSSICIQCRKFFCAFHKAGFFHDAKHTVLLFEDIVLQPTQLQLALYELCIYHEQRLEKHCQTCKVSICAAKECSDAHATHAVVLLAEACLTEKTTLATVDGMLAEKVRKMKDRLLMLDEGLDQLENMHESIVESVNIYFDDIEKTLEAKRTEFLDSINNESSRCIDKQQMVKNGLQSWIKKSENIQNEFHAFLQTKTNNSSPNINQLQAAKVAYKAQISDCAGGATVAENKMVSYPEGKLRILLQNVLTMAPSFTSHSNDHGWENVLKCPGVKTFCVSSTGRVIYFVKDTVISSQIYSYDLTGKGGDASTTAKPVGDACLNGYASVAAVSENVIAVMEKAQTVLDLSSKKMKRSARLRFLDGRTGNLIRASPFQLHDKSEHVWLKCPGKLLYVCDGVFLSECDRMQDGSIVVLRRFNFHKMVSIAGFYPDGILEDIMWVLDYKTHCMLVFDGKQHVVSSVGGDGSTEGKFMSPMALAADQFGHVIVADSGNSRIQIFSRPGMFLKEFGCPAGLNKTNGLEAATPLPGSVTLQTFGNYLYLLDNKEDTIFRIKYI